MFIPPNKSITVKVGKEEHTFRPEDLFVSKDTEDEIRYAAGTLLFFFRLAAEARRALKTLDAEFHKWRSSETFAKLQRDPKLSEWKSRTAIEATDECFGWKRRLARLGETVETLDGLVIAMRAKIDLLRTARADRRKEMETAGEVDPLSRSRSRVEKVSAALKGGKK